jgi:hypothetical protein
VEGCARTYRFKGDLKYHVQHKHLDRPDLPAMISRPRSDKVGKEYPCPWASCASGFKWERDLKRHIKVKHGIDPEQATYWNDDGAHSYESGDSMSSISSPRSSIHLQQQNAFVPMKLDGDLEVEQLQQQQSQIPVPQQQQMMSMYPDLQQTYYTSQSQQQLQTQNPPIYEQDNVTQSQVSSSTAPSSSSSSMTPPEGVQVSFPTAESTPSVPGTSSSSSPSDPPIATTNVDSGAPPSTLDEAATLAQEPRSEASQMLNAPQFAQENYAAY